MFTSLSKNCIFYDFYSTECRGKFIDNLSKNGMNMLAIKCLFKGLLNTSFYDETYCMSNFIKGAYESYNKKLVNFIINNEIDSNDKISFNYSKLEGLLRNSSIDNKNINEIKKIINSDENYKYQYKSFYPHSFKNTEIFKIFYEKFGYNELYFLFGYCITGNLERIKNINLSYIRNQYLYDALGWALEGNSFEVIEYLLLELDINTLDRDSLAITLLYCNNKKYIKKILKMFEYYLPPFSTENFYKNGHFDIVKFCNKKYNKKNHDWDLKQDDEKLKKYLKLNKIFNKYILKKYSKTILLF